MRPGSVSRLNFIDVQVTLEEASSVQAKTGKWRKLLHFFISCSWNQKTDFRFQLPKCGIGPAIVLTITAEYCYPNWRLSILLFETTPVLIWRIMIFYQQSVCTYISCSVLSGCNRLFFEFSSIDRIYNRNNICKRRAPNLTLCRREMRGKEILINNKEFTQSVDNE